MKIALKTFGIIAFGAILVFSTAACSKGGGSSGGRSAGGGGSGSNSAAVAPAIPDSPESDFEVEDNSIDGGKSVRVTKYTGSDTEVRVPAKIQGKPVTAVIGFYANKTITSVHIPEGVTDIGSFMYCDNLSSVSLPSTLERIGEAVFSGIPLTEISLPAGLRSIGMSAFTRTHLASFPDPWPKAVTTISSAAFAETKIQNLVIPEGVTIIQGSTFARCENLTSVTLPSTIKEVMSDAFADNMALTSVTLPSAIENLHRDAFSGCKNLDEASQERIRQIQPRARF